MAYRTMTDPRIATTGASGSEERPWAGDTGNFTWKTEGTNLQSFKAPPSKKINLDDALDEALQNVADFDSTIYDSFKTKAEEWKQDDTDVDDKVYEPARFEDFWKKLADNASDAETDYKAVLAPVDSCVGRYGSVGEFEEEEGFENGEGIAAALSRMWVGPRNQGLLLGGLPYGELENGEDHMSDDVSRYLKKEKADDNSINDAYRYRRMVNRIRYLVRHLYFDVALFREAPGPRSMHTKQEAGFGVFAGLNYFLHHFMLPVISWSATGDINTGVYAYCPNPVIQSKQPKPDVGDDVEKHMMKITMHARVEKDRIEYGEPGSVWLFFMEPYSVPPKNPENYKGVVQMVTRLAWGGMKETDRTYSIWTAAGDIMAVNDAGKVEDSTGLLLSKSARVTLYPNHESEVCKLVIHMSRTDMLRVIANAATKGVPASIKDTIVAKRNNASSSRPVPTATSKKLLEFLTSDNGNHSGVYHMGVPSGYMVRDRNRQFTNPVFALSKVSPTNYELGVPLAEARYREEDGYSGSYQEHMTYPDLLPNQSSTKDNGQDALRTPDSTLRSFRNDDDDFAPYVSSTPPSTLSKTDRARLRLQPETPQFRQPSVSPPRQEDLEDFHYNDESQDNEYIQLDYGEEDALQYPPRRDEPSGSGQTDEEEYEEEEQSHAYTPPPQSVALSKIDAARRRMRAQENQYVTQTVESSQSDPIEEWERTEDEDSSSPLPPPQRDAPSISRSDRPRQRARPNQYFSPTVESSQSDPIKEWESTDDEDSLSLTPLPQRAVPNRAEAARRRMQSQTNQTVIVLPDEPEVYNEPEVTRDYFGRNVAPTDWEAKYNRVQTALVKAKEDLLEARITCTEKEEALEQMRKALDENGVQTCSVTDAEYEKLKDENGFLRVRIGGYEKMTLEAAELQEELETVKRDLLDANRIISEYEEERNIGGSSDAEEQGGVAQPGPVPYVRLDDEAPLFATDDTINHVYEDAKGAEVQSDEEEIKRLEKRIEMLVDMLYDMGDDGTATAEDREKFSAELEKPRKDHDEAKRVIERYNDAINDGARAKAARIVASYSGPDAREYLETTRRERDRINELLLMILDRSISSDDIEIFHAANKKREGEIQEAVREIAQYKEDMRVAVSPDKQQEDDVVGGSNQSEEEGGSHSNAEVEGLRAEIERLEKLVESKDDELAKQKGENATLAARVAGDEEKLRKQTEALQKSVETMKSLKRNEQRYSKAKKKHVKRIEQQEETLKRAVVRVNTLRRLREDAQAKLKAAEKTLSLQSGNYTKRGEKIGQLEAELKALRARVGADPAAQSELDAEIAKLKREVDDLNGKYRAAQDTFDRSKTRFDRRGRELEESKRGVERLQMELDSLRAAADENEREHTAAIEEMRKELEARQTEAQQKIDELGGQITDCNDQRSALQAEIAVLKEAHEGGDMSAPDADIIKRQIERLTAQVLACDAKLDGLRADVDAIKQYSGTLVTSEQFGGETTALHKEHADIMAALRKLLNEKKGGGGRKTTSGGESYDESEEDDDDDEEEEGEGKGKGKADEEADEEEEEDDPEGGGGRKTTSDGESYDESEEEEDTEGGGGGSGSSTSGTSDGGSSNDAEESDAEMYDPNDTSEDDDANKRLLHAMNFFKLMTDEIDTLRVVGDKSAPLFTSFPTVKFIEKYIEHGSYSEKAAISYILREWARDDEEGNPRYHNDAKNRECYRRFQHVEARLELSIVVHEMRCRCAYTYAVKRLIGSNGEQNMEAIKPYEVPTRKIVTRLKVGATFKNLVKVVKLYADFAPPNGADMEKFLRDVITTGEWTNEPSGGEYLLVFIKCIIVGLTTGEFQDRLRIFEDGDTERRISGESLNPHIHVRRVVHNLDGPFPSIEIGDASAQCTDFVAKVHARVRMCIRAMANAVSVALILSNDPVIPADGRDVLYNAITRAIDSTPQSSVFQYFVQKLESDPPIQPLDDEPDGHARVKLKDRMRDYAVEYFDSYLGPRVKKSGYADQLLAFFDRVKSTDPGTLFATEGELLRIVSEVLGKRCASVFDLMRLSEQGYGLSFSGFLSIVLRVRLDASGDDEENSILSSVGNVVYDPADDFLAKHRKAAGVFCDILRINQKPDILSGDWLASWHEAEDRTHVPISLMDMVLFLTALENSVHAYALYIVSEISSNEYAAPAKDLYKALMGKRYLTFPFDETSLAQFIDGGKITNEQTHAKINTKLYPKIGGKDSGVFESAFRLCDSFSPDVDDGAVTDSSESSDHDFSATVDLLDKLRDDRTVLVISDDSSDENAVEDESRHGQDDDPDVVNTPASTPDTATEWLSLPDNSFDGGTGLSFYDESVPSPVSTYLQTVYRQTKSAPSLFVSPKEVAKGSDLARVRAGLGLWDQEGAKARTRKLRRVAVVNAIRSEEAPDATYDDVQDEPRDDLMDEIVIADSRVKNNDPAAIVPTIVEAWERLQKMIADGIEWSDDEMRRRSELAQEFPAPGRKNIAAFPIAPQFKAIYADYVNWVVLAGKLVDKLRGKGLSRKDRFRQVYVSEVDGAGNPLAVKDRIPVSMISDDMKEILDICIQNRSKSERMAGFVAYVGDFLLARTAASRAMVAKLNAARALLEDMKVGVGIIDIFRQIEYTPPAPHGARKVSHRQYASGVLFRALSDLVCDNDRPDNERCLATALVYLWATINAVFIEYSGMLSVQVEVRVPPDSKLVLPQDKPSGLDDFDDSEDDRHKAKLPSYDRRRLSTLFWNINGPWFMEKFLSAADKQQNSYFYAWKVMMQNWSAALVEISDYRHVASEMVNVIANIHTLKDGWWDASEGAKTKSMLYDDTPTDDSAIKAAASMMRWYTQQSLPKSVDVLAQELLEFLVQQSVSLYTQRGKFVSEMATLNNTAKGIGEYVADTHLSVGELSHAGDDVNPKLPPDMSAAESIIERINSSHVFHNWHLLPGSTHKKFTFILFDLHKWHAALMDFYERHRLTVYGYLFNTFVADNKMVDEGKKGVALGSADDEMGTLLDRVAAKRGNKAAETFFARSAVEKEPWIPSIWYDEYTVFDYLHASDERSLALGEFAYIESSATPQELASIWVNSLPTAHIEKIYRMHVGTDKPLHIFDNAEWEQGVATLYIKKAEKLLAVTSREYPNRANLKIDESRFYEISALIRSFTHYGKVLGRYAITTDNIINIWNMMSAAARRIRGRNDKKSMVRGPNGVAYSLVYLAWELSNRADSVQRTEDFSILLLRTLRSQQLRESIAGAYHVEYILGSIVRDMQRDHGLEMVAPASTRRISHKDKGTLNGVFTAAFANVVGRFAQLPDLAALKLNDHVTADWLLFGDVMTQTHGNLHKLVVLKSMPPDALLNVMTRLNEIATNMFKHIEADTPNAETNLHTYPLINAWNSAIYRGEQPDPWLGCPASLKLREISVCIAFLLRKLLSIAEGKHTSDIHSINLTLKRWYAETLYVDTAMKRSFDYNILMPNRNIDIRRYYGWPRWMTRVDAQMKGSGELEAVMKNVAGVVLADNDDGPEYLSRLFEQLEKEEVSKAIYARNYTGSKGRLWSAIFVERLGETLGGTSTFMNMLVTAIAVFHATPLTRTESDRIAQSVDGKTHSSVVKHLWNASQRVQSKLIARKREVISEEKLRLAVNLVIKSMYKGEIVFNATEDVLSDDIPAWTSIISECVKHVEPIRKAYKSIDDHSDIFRAIKKMEAMFAGKRSDELENTRMKTNAFVWDLCVFHAYHGEEAFKLYIASTLYGVNQLWPNFNTKIEDSKYDGMMKRLSMYMEAAAYPGVIGSPSPVALRLEWLRMAATTLTMAAATYKEVESDGAAGSVRITTLAPPAKVYTANQRMALHRVHLLRNDIIQDTFLPSMSRGLVPFTSDYMSSATDSIRWYLEGHMLTMDIISAIPEYMSERFIVELRQILNLPIIPMARPVTVPVPETAPVARAKRTLPLPAARNQSNGESSKQSKAKMTPQIKKTTFAMEPSYRSRPSEPVQSYTPGILWDPARERGGAGSMSRTFRKRGGSAYGERAW